MVEIQKKGEEYFVEYHAQGLTFAKCAGTDLSLAEKLKEEIKSSYPDNIEDMYEVRDDAIDDFLKSFRSFAKVDLPKKTYFRYMSVLDHFEDFLNHNISKDRKMKEITPALIEKYKGYILKLRSFNEGRVKPKMINFTFYILKDILDYAIKLGCLNDNPVLHIKVLTDHHGSYPHCLEEAERHIIISKCDETTGYVVDLMIACGLSIKEIKNLTWEDVDFQTNLINVRQQLDKQWGVRQIPMDAVALQIFKTIKEREKLHTGKVFPIFDRGIFMAALNEISEQPDVKNDLTDQTLRNTFIINLLKKNVPFRKILMHVGWTDIARMMRYESCFFSFQNAL